MSRRTKTVFVFLAGLIVGGVIGAVVVGYQTRKMMAHYAEVALIEAATDARQIASGQADIVFERKNRAIPGMVLSIEGPHGPYVSQGGRLSALWAAQRYYDQVPTAEPDEPIRSILGELPPRPKTCCEMKQGR